MDRDGAPQIDWTSDGVPVSRRFDDPYYSLTDGAAETAHVFLAGNGLPARFCEGFHIAELGFGTGLNLLVAWSAWRSHDLPGRLHFTSFEAFPLQTDVLEQAHRRWPEFAELSEEFLGSFGGHHVETRDLSFHLILGDARQTVGSWEGQADAWFLDGFSPAKNPELWEPALMTQVYRRTAPGGTFATYSAAGAVRRGLQEAGFNVERVPGFAHKRHMTRGHRQ